MLKLMIVDDENLFREALKVSIPWNKLGYEVCCEAENGADALEKIAEYKPDVALVDINMPIMDGLELAAEIKEKGLFVRTIIITGYGEFNYARQAIEVGVENYLLKPIDEDELQKALTDIRKSLEMEKKAALEIKQISYQAKEYKPLIRKLKINDLFYAKGEIEDKDIEELKSIYNIDFTGSSFQVVVIEIEEGGNCLWSGEERQLWCFSVANIASEIFGEYYFFEVSWDAFGRINIIVKEAKLKGAEKKDIANLCERIRLAVSKYLKFSVTIGIGSEYSKACQISKSYTEARLALKEKIIGGCNRVIKYGDNLETYFSIVPYTTNMRQQILISMRLVDINEVEAIIDDIFKELSDPRFSSEAVMMVCIELFSTCVEYSSEVGCNIKSILDCNSDLIKEIEKRRSLAELNVWIKTSFKTIIRYVQDQGLKKRSKVVEEAEKYIGDNYHRYDLKVDDIARHVYVKYGYLCFLFKRDVGKTINDYLTNLRITKAKELFDNGILSVAEVSSKVGYVDANYFGKCFKKIIGISPAKYIETKP